MYVYITQHQVRLRRLQSTIYYCICWYCITASHNIPYNYLAEVFFFGAITPFISHRGNIGTSSPVERDAPGLNLRLPLPPLPPLPPLLLSVPHEVTEEKLLKREQADSPSWSSTAAEEGGRKGCSSTAVLRTSSSSTYRVVSARRGAVFTSVQGASESIYLLPDSQTERE